LQARFPREISRFQGKSDSPKGSFPTWAKPIEKFLLMRYFDSRRKNSILAPSKIEARSALKLLNGVSAGLRALPVAPQNIAAGGLQPYVGYTGGSPHA
jgi:hypothetical protein